MKTELLTITPVLPSKNIDRDMEWYREFTGFTSVYKDDMYAVINRENLYIHLQWHADTEDDPLLGGSVIRILVKNLDAIFKEFVERGTIKPEKLHLKTAWNTNEFGFFDMNKNAIFIVESL